MQIPGRLVFGVLTAIYSLSAQTTQGLISGRILNSVTGRPVPAASVAYNGTTLSARGTVRSDAQGFYFLPLLSAGTYTIRTTADSYQPQELQELELPVAGRLNIDFRLRPLNDVWESGQFRSVFLPGTKTIVTFFGPDVDASRSGSFEAQKGSRGTLDTSASYVINPTQIAELPLQGRDVYTMLVSLPGVTADTATGRGLGVSVAGQRPSASNFLLDGVENDNHLITGPLVRIAPEAVQEYRISTNNYSAEYGRTSGFVANAVTKAGGGDYHGILYEYLKNDALNATDFADNLVGNAKRKSRENQFGYQFGGPVVPKGELRSRLFFSSSLEQLISHSTQAELTLLMPTTTTLSSFNVPSSRQSYHLLTDFRRPVIDSKRAVDAYTVSPPVIVNRLLALERGDYVSKSGRDHLLARVAIGKIDEPYFIWTPYPDFISPLQQNTTGVAGGWQRTWTPRVTSELKVSYSDDNLWWDRPHPEVPTLVAYADPVTLKSVTLPGSSALYAYRNHNRSLETIYSNVITRNRHVVTFGGGLVLRFNSGYLTAGRDSEFVFTDITAFLSDSPHEFLAAVDRTITPLTTPAYNRKYRYNNSFYFVQDSFRASPRLTFNFGLRYERFAAPSNTGPDKDALIALGSGADFNARLESAKLVVGGSGTQQIFGTDNSNWAPRFGFTWDPFGKSSTLIRGGFGIFYDRPFDNLWQNVRANRYAIGLFDIPGARTNYLAPISGLLKNYSSYSSDLALTLVDPSLRNGYAQSAFVGVQRAVGDSLTLDLNLTSTRSRRLITTDVVNRQYTTDTGRPQFDFPDVAWRSGQGKADYYGLGTLIRYRRRTLQLQGAYTFSHSIDNQSDALVGDFFDLNFTSFTGGGSNTSRAAFQKQFDSSGDRGSSDFDQKHSLFLMGIWSPASRWRIAKDWRIASMAAFRTGTAYSVVTPSTTIPDSGGVILNQRADLLDPRGGYLAAPQPVSGGVQVLNPAAFTEPVVSGPGNLGRNSLRGPGLYNIDLSIARTFPVPRLWKLRETATITLRADAFNVLNHANLGNPANLVGQPDFGVSTFGRQGTSNGFPASSPLNDAARSFQLMLRAQF